MQKRGILRLLNAPARYIKNKVKDAYNKLVKKEPKKATNRVYNEEILKRTSIDELKEIKTVVNQKRRFSYYSCKIRNK